jgi:hypothetical protein
VKESRTAKYLRDATGRGTKARVAVEITSRA